MITRALKGSSVVHNTLTMFQKHLSRRFLKLQCHSFSTQVLQRTAPHSRLYKNAFPNAGGTPHGLLFVSSCPPLPSSRFRASYSSSSPPSNPKQQHESPTTSTKSEDSAAPEPTTVTTIRENIYTLPNVITLSRILSCPILGWSIVTGDFYLASGIVVYAGFTDWLDGYLARQFKMQSVMGTILDPAADKALMTTLVISLAMKGLLPLPLAVIVLGRDVLLSISAFYYRYISLPEPKTFTRYWDFSIPSAEVRPTTISKVNTALQLLLMTTTVFNQVLPYDLDISLEAMQWIVAGTTIWSGLSYVGSKDAVRILSKKVPPP